MEMSRQGLGESLCPELLLGLLLLAQGEIMVLLQLLVLGA